MLNDCSFIGNVGRITTKTLQSGKKVSNFSLAVPEKKSEPPLWLDCSAWEKLADICQQYVEPGRKLYVQGKLVEKMGKNKEGIDVKKVSIMVNKLILLGTPKQGESQIHGEPMPVEDTWTGDVPF